ncbi:MAG: glycoside hydrolase family 88 protein [Opitutae bacterium]|nr:glycoside hydrolase family 88 protein [Opitutae bacterium]
MERVADWQIANPSKWSPAGWHQSAYYAGVMALAELSRSSRFEEAMLKMGRANNWQLEKRPYHADDHCVGQTYVALYRRHRDPQMLVPLRERFDWILAHPKPEDLSFAPEKKDRNDTWSWCDALFMGPPTWARLAVVTGEKKYWDFLIDKWWKTSAHLYDQEESLYYRDDTYLSHREANGKKIFWSRGNGWVMGGLVRVLAEMPADNPARARFVQQFREMSARLLALQPADGLWRASLLDPASYPRPEASGSGFITYGLAWGINQGLLDRAKFEPAVRKAWQALVACVQSDGRLTHVQPVGSQPKKDFDANSTEVYGVGAFLLAGSEVYRLANGTVPQPKAP